MKFFKLGLRLWMVLASTGSFMAGWIMLAHAPKPAQSTSPASGVSVVPLPTLAPLAPLNFTDNSSVQTQTFSVQSAPVQAPVQSYYSAPTFVTGGS